MTTYQPHFFNIKFKTVATALSIAGLYATLLARPSYAASAASESFKDANLKNCVIQTYNRSNGTNLTKLTVKQLATITKLSCQNMGISDASGIERLTKLASLSLLGNQISSINLSKNTQLTTLDLRFNSLRSLDIGKQAKLTTLYLNGNNLSELDIRKNKQLAKFRADNILLNTNATASRAGSIYTLDLSSLKFYSMPTHLYFGDAYDYNDNLKLLAAKNYDDLANMMNTGAGFNYSWSSYRIKLPTAKNVSMNAVATQVAKVYKDHAKTYVQLVLYLAKYGITEPQTRSAMRQAGISYDNAALYSDAARLLGYYAGKNARY